jgi:XTP/dITP diphosphohydrolase
VKHVVLATGNAGKVREIREIFADLDLEIVPQSAYGIESPEETGETFVENAMLKARFAAGATGLPAMADDSGIVVDALDGRPGIFSARYAGEGATDDDNLDLLLQELQDVPDEQRGGGFHCAAVLAFPDDDPPALIAEAVWRGRILRARRGTGGFGYDPVFLDVASGKTGAEMAPAAKNAVSHRGSAFRELHERLAASGLAG